MSNLIQVNSVTKDFTGHRALEDVTISIPKQSIFGLLGPNGAGKTTLIRIINTIIGPDKGEVFFENKKMRPELVNKIGYLPEERGLYKKMEVGEQALYLAQLKGLKKNYAKKLLIDWFDKYELLPWWDKKVEALSKGMQQKLQFITTVLHKPELLIFDEPFSGFDPINVNMLKDEILNLKKQGATVIFSTHNMESVEELCDHIALINKSKNVLDGNVNDIKSNYSKQIFKVEITNLTSSIDNINNNTFELLSHSPKKNLVEAIIKINKNNVPTNELLKELVQLGNIISFNEVLPSMNEIFIKTVSEKQTVF